MMLASSGVPCDWAALRLGAGVRPPHPAVRAEVAADLDPDKIERLLQLVEEAGAREVIATSWSRGPRPTPPSRRRPRRFHRCSGQSAPRQAQRARAGGRSTRMMTGETLPGTPWMNATSDFSGTKPSSGAQEATRLLGQVIGGRSGSAVMAQPSSPDRVIGKVVQVDLWTAVLRSPRRRRAPSRSTCWPVPPRRTRRPPSVPAAPAARGEVSLMRSSSR